MSEGTTEVVEQTTPNVEATEDVPKEEISKEDSPEVSPKESKISEPKELTFEEVQKSKYFKDMQSAADTAKVRAEKAEQEAEEARTEASKHRLALERQALLDAGGDEESANKLLAKMQAAEEREEEAKKQIAKAKAALDAAAPYQKRMDAESFIEQYGLKGLDNSLEDLMEAKSKEEMELIAKILSRRKGKPESTPKISHKPASVTSSVPLTSDEEWKKRWVAGEIEPTKENIARANKIRNNL